MDFNQAGNLSHKERAADEIVKALFVLRVAVLRFHHVAVLCGVRA
jgi:hypothetical protein